MFDAHAASIVSYKAHGQTNQSCAFWGSAADANCLKVPDHMSDDQVLLLSDVLCTSWHSTELGGVGEGDIVAIWGAGPGERSDEKGLIATCVSLAV